MSLINTNQIDNLFKTLEKDKIDNFFFLIIDSKDLHSIENILTDMLFNPLFTIIDNKLICIYQDKERFLIKNYIDSISEDIGYPVKIFEGFKMNMNHKDDLNDFLNIYLNNYYTDFSYSNISDFVIKIAKENNQIIGKIKQIVFRELLLDNQFLIIVKAMFENDLNVSKTSAQIYMHRNTLNLKINTIENNTTLSLRKVKDAFVIYELLK